MLDRLFDLTLFLKAAHAVFEIVLGFLLLTVSRGFITRNATSIVNREFNRSSTEGVARVLLRAIDNFSLELKIFFAIYLLAAGCINLLLIYGLVKKKLWVYPTAMVVFFGFIVYQSYRFMRTGSVWLLALDLLDIVLITLIFIKYKKLAKSIKRKKR